MIVTAIIIGAVVYATNHASQFEKMTRGRKALVTFAILFVSLMILNMVWPYGAGV
jgi:hypothetical protein